MYLICMEKRIIEPTLRAFLLNRFINENCFNLDLTTSPRGTFGAFLAFWSQGCSASNSIIE
ncbi:hypothetical protein HanXRQr2_Chr15g0671101 [Helianthus annuus]|uniref:Uncharacterized protein n=1 Tax=Helianthus annuus TaxID=4232 RepID=A0A9K3DXY6_HELAN|nr:hypothetical protein HanXRQr2_Chr15g0671101 [Helianthus annuus]